MISQGFRYFNIQANFKIYLFAWCMVMAKIVAF